MRQDRHIIEARAARVRALYAKGLSIDHIAFREGISTSTVKRDLRPSYRARDRNYEQERRENGKQELAERQCEFCKATFTLAYRHQRCCSEACAKFRFEWRRFYPDYRPSSSPC